MHAHTGKQKRSKKKKERRKRGEIGNFRN